MSEIESTVAPEAEQADSATVEPVEPAEPVEATAPAKATHDKITKKSLKEIYKNKDFNSEVDKVFPNDTKIYQRTNVDTLLSEKGINEKFNEVFLAREPAIKIGPNENAVHVYRDEKGMIASKRQNRAIIIVCTACVIKEEDNDYKIVIASRLDTRHSEDEKTMKGGSKEANKIFNYIEKKLNDNVKSATVLNEGDLDPSFINIMSDPLISKRNTEFKSEFIEYTVNKEDNVMSLTINKIINFKVTFCIIYDENKTNIYYSTKFDQNAIYTTFDTFNGTYKKIKKNAQDAEPAAPEKTGAEKEEEDTEPAKSPAEKEKQKENLKERVTAAEKEVHKLKENANANEAVTEAVTKAEKTVKEAKNKIENISEKEETGEFGIGAENVKYESAVKEAEDAVNAAEKAVNAAAPAAQEEPEAPRSALHDWGADWGEDPSLVDAAEGGGKRKLTRKQLNIMTLTELKQLHKVNKIKMNNNRTIKALINNYIKNYKKIISKTKIGR